METLKLALTNLSGMVGVLSAIAGAIATKYWLAVIIILSILKLAGLTSMPWFAGLTTLSAVGAGLWILALGTIFYLLGLIIMATAALFLNKK